MSKSPKKSPAKSPKKAERETEQQVKWAEEMDATEPEVKPIVKSAKTTPEKKPPKKVVSLDDVKSDEAEPDKEPDPQPKKSSKKSPPKKVVEPETEAEPDKEEAPEPTQEIIDKMNETIIAVGGEPYIGRVDDESDVDQLAIFLPLMFPSRKDDKPRKNFLLKLGVEKMPPSIYMENVGEVKPNSEEEETWLAFVLGNYKEKEGNFFEWTLWESEEEAQERVDFIIGEMSDEVDFFDEKCECGRPNLFLVKYNERKETEEGPRMDIAIIKPECACEKEKKAEKTPEKQKISPEPSVKKSPGRPKTKKEDGSPKEKKSYQVKESPGRSKNKNGKDEKGAPRTVTVKKMTPDSPN